MRNSDHHQTAEQTGSQEELQRMIFGGWISQCIHVAAKLGIADLLASGPQSCQHLAMATKTHEPSLKRFLRTLAGIGIFAEREEGVFGLTPLAEWLRTDLPDSLRDAAIMYGEEWHRNAWSQLLYSVKTGKTAFEQVYQTGFFQYLPQHPEVAQIFSRAMTSLSKRVNPVIVKTCDFRSFSRVVDVGGGHGSLMAAILKANPHLQGIIYDQPLVIEETEKQLQAEGLESRCECVAGSFFQSVPAGGDLYLLKHIIHDWADEEAVLILKNCRAAMQNGGRLLLVEHVLPEGNAPSPGKLIDMEMLVMAGGKERTEQEFKSLLGASRFHLQRVLPTSSPIAIIEAEAV